MILLGLYFPQPPVWEHTSTDISRELVVYIWDEGIQQKINYCI